MRCEKSGERTGALVREWIGRGASERRALAAIGMSASALRYCPRQGCGTRDLRARRCARAGSVGTQSRLIQPGKPNQNAYVESFNARRRDECLNEHWFPMLLHARTEIERLRREYNEDRPRKAIGGMTPSAYAQHLANTDIINPRL